MPEEYLTDEMLDQKWSEAEQGVYFQGFTAYIQFWMENISLNTQKLDGWYEKYYAELKPQLTENLALAEHIATLQAAFVHFFMVCAPKKCHKQRKCHRA